MRLWGEAAVLALSPEHYCQALLMVSLDRHARNECAGYARRQPGHVVAIDEARLRRQGPA